LGESRETDVFKEDNTLQIFMSDKCWPFRSKKLLKTSKHPFPVTHPVYKTKNSIKFQIKLWFLRSRLLKDGGHIT